MNDQCHNAGKDLNPKSVVLMQELCEKGYRDSTASRRCCRACDVSGDLERRVGLIGGAMPVHATQARDFTIVHSYPSSFVVGRRLHLWHLSSCPQSDEQHACNQSRNDRTDAVIDGRYASYGPWSMDGTRYEERSRNRLWRWTADPAAATEASRGIQKRSEKEK